MRLFIKRRRFLVLVAGGLISTLALKVRQAFSGAILESATPPRAIVADLDQLFADPDSARAVGRRYLELHPEHADLQVLLNGARLGSDIHRSLLKEALDHQRRQDFLRGDTIVLDGWLLARSEIYVCTILALPIGR